MISPCMLQDMNGTDVYCLVVILCIMWSLHVGQVPMLVYFIINFYFYCFIYKVEIKTDVIAMAQRLRIV